MYVAKVNGRKLGSHWYEDEDWLGVCLDVLQFSRVQTTGWMTDCESHCSNSDEDEESRPGADCIVMRWIREKTDFDWRSQV